ncbi:MAG TPA: IS110 family transposase [Acetobacteraceae bacterium]|jgi:transposase|nr:IS110 family transposase [Acetobacteraceae bacterium]
MDQIHDRVGGLDVHKASVVCCVRLRCGGTAERECRSFATTTAGLEALLEWLEKAGCTHVAMEATGIYWRPVWTILCDGTFELVLANAAHIKNVPGRKTDMNDAMWIADLLACGLIRASFVPEPEMQDLRTLLRTRKQFVREQTRHVQRIQKTLEQGNIKLDAVISDILGISGRRMIEAMIAGESNPQTLAALADRRLKARPDQLGEALHGRLNQTHRFLLRTHLKQWDDLEAAIVELDRQVDARIADLQQVGRFRLLTALLCKIPGVSKLSAISILAEIGIDMSRFRTAAQLVAWAGLCPGQNQSAGKRKSSRLRKGAPWLKTMLVQCAWAAKRQNNSYYRAQFYRLAGRRGPQKAICAVAASILTAIYHIILRGTPYQDLGADHFDRRSTNAKVNRLVAQLTRLGYDVHIQPLAPAA